jgi:hypothetical protein
MRSRPVATVLLLAAALAGCGSHPAPGSHAAGSTGSWEKVAESPLGPRESATLVWTGHEVLVLGGDTSPCPPNADCTAPENTPRDVAAYDPAADSWRQAAPLPYSPQWPRGVAAGGTVFVLDGGASQPVRFLSWTAAGDAWHELPAPPGQPAGLTAVGDRVVAYQTSLENGPAPDSVFDPAAGTWAPLPEPPGTPGFDRTVVATDDHTLVLLDLELVPNPGADGPTLYRAAVLDLTTSAWHRLPLSDVAGLGGGGWHAVGDLLVDASMETVDGGEVGSYGRDVPTGGVLDPASGAWSALPARADSAPGPAAGDVAGDDVVVTEGWALHVTDGRWERLPELDEVTNVSGLAWVWAGDRLMVWGGARFDDSTPAGRLLGDGWTWRPRGTVSTLRRSE